MLPYKDIATSIRDSMGVFNSIVKILQPHSLLNYVYNSEQKHAEISPENIDALHNSIKQYSTIKLIMEKNSTYVRDSQRVKIVDCHIMQIILADLAAHKNILKVQDDNFIFIRRTTNRYKQQQVPNNKRTKDTLESDNLFIDNQSNAKNHTDTEASKESRTRQKAIFKKLLFFDTRKMLSIL